MPDTERAARRELAVHKKRENYGGRYLASGYQGAYVEFFPLFSFEIAFKNRVFMNGIPPKRTLVGKWPLTNFRGSFQTTVIWPRATPSERTNDPSAELRVACAASQAIESVGCA